MKFKLIHKETGLTLRQYKRKNKLNVYLNKILVKVNWINEELKYMIREDGAIAVQRIQDWYSENHELYFLKREDWEIKMEDMDGRIM